MNIKVQVPRKYLLIYCSSTVHLGINLVKRRSLDSTVTRTFMKSFAQLEQEVASGDVKKPQCGCGLPHNLLLPRGTEAGMIFDLFVMVTNGEEDADGILGDQSKNFCTAPYHWCGRPGQTYPDKKPLAYPFDRLPPSAPNGRRVKSIDEFSELIPNSKTIQVILNFHLSCQLLQKCRITVLFLLFTF